MRLAMQSDPIAGESITMLFLVVMPDFHPKMRQFRIFGWYSTLEQRREYYFAAEVFAK